MRSNSRCCEDDYNGWSGCVECHCTFQRNILRGANTLDRGAHIIRGIYYL